MTGVQTCALPIWGSLAAWTPSPAILTSLDVPVVSSRLVDIDYTVTRAAHPLTRVEIWFTTDQGLTWWSHGTDDDCTPPARFKAPGEGLYGFFILALNQAGPSSLPPTSGIPPQTQCLVDLTPPVVQLHQVARAEDFASSRTVCLRWTSYDAYPADRPISIYYRQKGDDLWREIVTHMADTRAYDWVMPEKITGPISLKLIVRDQAGNATEQVWTGQLATAAAPIDTPDATPLAAPIIASAVAQSQPAIAPPQRENAHRARALYEQASWHIVRGELDVAAERLAEALALDQTLTDARTDLAAVAYARRDYERSLLEYQRVLAIMPTQAEALRGSALAHMALHQHSQARAALQRLLLIEPDNPQTWLDLGDVAFQMGARQGALEAWTKAAQIDPANKELTRQARRRLEAFAVKP